MSRFFTGKIQEIQVFNRRLSEMEIKELYKEAMKKWNKHKFKIPDFCYLIVCFMGCLLFSIWFISDSEWITIIGCSLGLVIAFEGAILFIVAHTQGLISKQNDLIERMFITFIKEFNEVLKEGNK